MNMINYKKLAEHGALIEGGKFPDPLGRKE